MDETAQRVACRHPQEPHDHQDYKDCPKHIVVLPEASSLGFALHQCNRPAKVVRSNPQFSGSSDTLKSEWKEGAFNQ